MRTTIIPADGTVIKGNESYSRLDLSSCNIPLNIHALQFNNGAGWIEFNDGTNNQKILALPDWAEPCITQWQARDDEFKKPTPMTKQDYEAKCERIAKDALSDTDWAILPDVGLKNVEEFKAYRSKMRQFAINPVETPDFPIKPSPVW